jgi:hypothetical protein
MKAAYYRPTPVLTSHLELMGVADKYPVIEFENATPDFPEFRMVPAGFVIEHPEAWRLVKQGTAKAADEECEKRMPMTPEQRNRRYERQKALEAGKLTGDPKLDRA